MGKPSYSTGCNKLEYTTRWAQNQSMAARERSLAELRETAFERTQAKIQRCDKLPTRRTSVFQHLRLGEVAFVDIHTGCYG